MPSYPRWIDRREDFFLREVAPGLYVGADRSPELEPDDDGWAAVVDFYGSSKDHPKRYRGADVVLRWPFYDGYVLPPGALDAVEAILRGKLRDGPVLLHCQAGLSRSASTAYAMLRVLGGHDHAEALRRVKAEPGFPRPTTLRSAREWAERRISRGAKRLRKSQVRAAS